MIDGTYHGHRACFTYTGTMVHLLERGSMKHTLCGRQSCGPVDDRFCEAYLCGTCRARAKREEGRQA